MAPQPSRSSVPRFTIVIPCLDQARYLERAICSVIDQDYCDLELIVTDGGSIDGSSQVIAMYQDQVTLWRTESDRGPAAAVNAALAKATGKLVGVLHADNLLLPGTLHEIARTLDRPQSSGWVVGHAIRVDEHDRDLGPIAAEAPESLGDFLEHVSGLLPEAASFFRREVFDAAGGFDDHLRHAYGYDLACRLLAKGHAPTIVPHALAAVRERAETSVTQRMLAVGREYITAATRCASALPAAEREALRQSCDERRRIYAIAQAQADRSHARRLLWARLLRHPHWLADPHYRYSLLHDSSPALPQAA